MRNVAGVFETQAGAEAAMRRLNAAGITPDAVSVAMKRISEKPIASEVSLASGVIYEGDPIGEGTAVGAVSGAAVGTIVGLFVAGGTFVLPGVGTFLIAGPYFAGLAGAGVGAASGGVLGALIGSGIPEDQASAYATDVVAGRVVLVARVVDSDSEAVGAIFDEEGSCRTYSTCGHRRVLGPERRSAAGPAVATSTLNPSRIRAARDARRRRSSAPT